MGAHISARERQPSGSRSPGAGPGDRLVVLDGVRMVAALSVLFYHYAALQSAWGTPPSTLFPLAGRFAVYGWLGVEIFFLVSGFVICMSAWGRTLGDFAVSRVSRLFPAYWAAVAFTATVLFTWPEVRAMGPFSNVVVNLSMLQHGIGIPDLDDAYWTLFAELKFYALFALVVARGVTYRNCVLFCGIWTLGSAVAPAIDNSVLSFFAVSSCSPYFIGGIAFHLMRRFGPNAVLWGIVGVQFLLAQNYVHGRMISNLGPGLALKTPAWPAHTVIALGFLAMAAIALGVFDGMRWRWLPYAGALTYPLYLIHMMAGLTIIHHFRTTVAPVPLALSVTALMLVLAWVIHRLVERPLGRLLGAGLRRGIEDIRAGTPRRAPLPAIPAQASAPDAEQISAGR
ncbi:acyltransferase [Streptomyces sp. NPDC006326]|uniref:acyltransferase family protein n=1 Tax=Streptomyces sp. NPDC006326 TaxID=3156752 RepID=UPI0033B77850